MEVLEKIEIEKVKFYKGVGLGNFDGLHIGHMTLINTLINESKLNNIKSLIYTFMSHPENILRKKLITPQITTKMKKIDLLKNTQLDYIYFREFDETFSRLTPEEFIDEILVNQFKAKLIVVGFDFRFGYKGRGDVKLLKEMAQKYSYRLIVIPPIMIRDNKISSTIIREHILSGKMRKVCKYMGRYFSISGKVRTGKKMGRKIGFPTANIEFDKFIILPKNGVYITKTLFEGKYFDSVTNIGYNPTFSQKKISIETYILNFSYDIYDKFIEVFFIKWIREEMKFDNLNSLINKIDEDVKITKKYFENESEIF